MNDYYVYILFRADGRPFYVGKGRGDRWTDHERRLAKRPTHKDHLVAKMKREGADIPKAKVAENLSDDEAYSVEIEMIRAIGRYPCGPLLNATDGGEGHSNPSPEAKAKRRETTRGRPVVS